MADLRVTVDPVDEVYVAIVPARTSWCRCHLCGGPMYQGEPFVWCHEMDLKAPAHYFKGTCEWHRERQHDH